MKKVLLIVLSICLILGLASCTNSSAPSPASSQASPAAGQGSAAPSASAPAPAAEPVTITFGMWDENQKPTYEQIIAKFMEENPNIKVELILTPWDQYWTKLDAAAGAKNDPDVYWMNVYMPKYADAGVLEPLDSYIAADKVDLSLWAEGAVSMYQYNGKQWGIPINSDSVVVAYNKAIFDKYGVEHPKEGWTWQDMVDLGAQLRDKIAAAGGSEYPMVMELDGQPSYLQFITQNGVNLYPDLQTQNWAAPGTIKAFEDIVALMDANIMPPNKVLSDTKGTDLFISGRAAMVYVGSWKAIVLDECDIAKDIGLVTMPKKDDNNKCAVGGISFAMSANSKNKDAAWTFLKYMAGEESSRMQAEARIMMPACISAQEFYSPQFKNIPGEVFPKQANISAPYPFHPAGPSWGQDQTDITNKIYNKEITAEEGCKQLAEISQKYIDEYNKK